MWEYNIRVTRVVDGDTIDAQVDLGFFTHKNIRIRVNGIDTPEVRTRDADEKKRGFAAKERMEDLLKHSKQNSIVSLGLDKFGRCLADVFVHYPGGVRKAADILIEEGHGVEYHGGKR